MLVVLHVPLHGLEGVDDGGMVTARELPADLYPIGEFTNAGLFVLCILMFIGASPGSTGGGIKTSTFFIMFQKIGKSTQWLVP